MKLVAVSVGMIVNIVCGVYYNKVTLCGYIVVTLVEKTPPDIEGGRCKKQYITKHKTEVF